MTTPELKTLSHKKGSTCPNVTRKGFPP